MRTIAFEHEKAGADHDGHVRNIENTCPQRANTNIYEVDDPAIGDAIDDIGGGTGEKESGSELTRFRPAKPHGGKRQENHQQRVSHSEDHGADRQRPSGTKIKESASILGVLKSTRVRQK
jgi:hypothetical protein